MLAWIKKIRSWLQPKPVHGPLFKKRVTNLRYALTERKKTQTIPFIVDYTGWPEKDVIQVVEYMVQEGILKEELDMDEGIWFYFTPNTSNSKLEHLTIAERSEKLKEDE